MNPYIRTVPMLALLLAVGCSNNAVKIYEESSYGPPLEVPPDLTAPSRDPELLIPDLPDTGDTAATPGAALPKVAPDVAGIRLNHDGALRWLSLTGSPEQIWPWVRDFFLDQGFALSIEDPKLGIVETDWKQERSALPSGPRKVKIDDELVPVYGVPMREKYRARLDRSADGKGTEIWLSHRGAVLEKDGDEILWRPAPPDHELEVAKLKALMIYLGVAQENAQGMLATAKRVSQTTVEKDEQGGLFLKVNQEFQRVWRRVGVALERMKYSVDDKDRSVGIWYISGYDPLAEKKEKGWFSSDDRTKVSYRVLLTDESESVSIQLRDDKDKPVPVAKAEPFLRELAGWLE